MKYKRNIYFLIITIVIFFVFNYAYSKIFNKTNFIEVYVLSEQLNRGDIITKDKINIIKIQNNNVNQSYEPYYISESDIGNFVLKDSYEKGQILLKSMSVPSNQYNTLQNNNEIISVGLDKLDNNVSNQIQKGSIINLYYTGKTTQVKSILNNINSTSIVSDSPSESYLTFIVLEKCRVLGIFDVNGNSIQNDINTKANSNIKINTITLETTKENALVIKNIKEYGEFSASITK